MGSRGALLVALVPLLALTSGCLAPQQDGTPQDPPPGTTLPPDATDPNQIATKSRASLHWIRLPDMPEALRSFACTLHDGELIVAGGVNGAGITQSRVDAYNIRAQTWDRVLPLPKPVHSAAAASQDGELLIMGGFQDLAGRPRQPAADVYELTGIGFWTEVGQLPEPVAQATPIHHGNQLLLVGGLLGADATTHILAHSTMQVWSVASQLNEPRVAPAVLTHGDELHVIGGQRLNSETNTNLTGEAVSLTQQTTRPLPAMPTARDSFATATAGTYLYVIGGQMDGQALNATELYDASNEIWWNGPPLPAATQRACAAAAADGIHLLGGLRDGETLAEHWLLTWL